MLHPLWNSSSSWVSICTGGPLRDPNLYAKPRAGLCLMCSGCGCSDSGGAIETSHDCNILNEPTSATELVKVRQISGRYQFWNMLSRYSGGIRTLAGSQGFCWLIGEACCDFVKNVHRSGKTLRARSLMEWNLEAMKMAAQRKNCEKDGSKYLSWELEVLGPIRKRLEYDRLAHTNGDRKWDNMKFIDSSLLVNLGRWENTLRESWKSHPCCSCDFRLQF